MTAEPVIPEPVTHREGKAQIHLPKVAHQGGSANAFLNPVQCYNRDLSVIAINTWAKVQYLERVTRRASKEERKKRTRPQSQLVSHENSVKKQKIDHAPADPSQNGSLADATVTSTVPNGNQAADSPNYGQISLFEGLAATGLRSIRYALELPHVTKVVANDMSTKAVVEMRRNLELNQSDETAALLAKVTVNEGDCISVMHQHTTNQTQFHVVDLDPYGTAAPFIDAAMRCLHDGGLLCVTCTDLAVLASTAYPEKCFANYGGAPVKAEYCHEMALRLVLHALSSSATRYGCYIEPLLSLSIDFYVRLFVRVHRGAKEVKNMLVKNATVSVCSHCDNSIIQPLGRVETDDKGNNKYKIAPVTSTNSRCELCGAACHLGGPFWSGPIHSPEFVQKMSDNLEKADPNQFATLVRMRGMVATAAKELPNPFYFTPASVASHFKCQSPPLASLVNALLHAGYQVSRSHACAGSIKTTAPRHIVHDIFRFWIKIKQPVTMANISEKSPTYRLLTQANEDEASSVEYDFASHPETEAVLLKDHKLVLFQQHPPNWGPGKRASS